MATRFTCPVDVARIGGNLHTSPRPRSGLFLSLKGGTWTFNERLRECTATIRRDLPADVVPNRLWPDLKATPQRILADGAIGVGVANRLEIEKLWDVARSHTHYARVKRQH